MIFHVTYRQRLGRYLGGGWGVFFVYFIRQCKPWIEIYEINPNQSF